MPTSAVRKTYNRFSSWMWSNQANSYPEGNFGGNQLLDGSISFFAPIPKFDDRFATSISQLACVD